MARTDEPTWTEIVVTAGEKINSFKGQIEDLQKRIEACEKELKRYDVLHTSPYWEEWER